MEKTKRYYLSVKILTAITALIGVTMAYFIIAAHNELDFGINWNMFNSILAWPLFIIGFILGLGQKFQVYESIIETRDSSGRVVKREKNNDIIDSTMAGCLMPILSYFVITPLIIAAIIYYTIMVIIYLFAAIFPYVIAVFIVISILFLYKCLNRSVESKFRHILIPGLAFLFILIYWLLYTLWVSGGNDTNASLAMIFAGCGAVISLGVFIPMIITVKDNSTDILIDEEESSKYNISGKFLITFIIISLLIVGVYCFKLLSLSPNVNQAYLSLQLTYDTYIVNTETALNVRSGAGAGYNKVGSVQNGDKIQVYSINGEWAEINYKGNKAYVSSKYLSPVTSSGSTSATSDESQIETKIENIADINTPETEDSPTPSQSETEINAVKTTGLINSHNVGYDKFYMAKRINQSERNLLKIDNINSSLPNNEISRGKVVYKNSNGRLETFLHVVEDHNTIEYLVSYNNNGDYIAHVAIGELGAYTGTRAYGLLTGNKLNVYYYYPVEPGDEQDETKTISYTITPQLRFVKR